MPSVLSHIAVPIAGRIAFGANFVVPRLFFLGLVASVLPDADVLLLRFGVPYESSFGHRGASHSLAFALLVSVIFSAFFARNTGQKGLAPWLYLFVCAASHPLLDTCTNAGHGAALLWPLSEERYFAAFRPIEASPLSLRRFFGEVGLRVLLSEFLWVWLPFITVATFIKLRQRGKRAA